MDDPRKYTDYPALIERIRLLESKAMPIRDEIASRACNAPDWWIYKFLKKEGITGVGLCELDEATCVRMEVEWRYRMADALVGREGSENDRV